MSNRFIVTSLALAAAIVTTTLSAQAATTQPAATRPALAHTPAHNAATQQRVAADLGHGRLSPQQAATLQTQVADLYRAQASALEAAPARRDDLADSARLLSAAVHDAEAARLHDAQADALDRLHLRVAALRDAEQQRWIAQGLRSGHLTPVQAAQLERAQADLAAQQASLVNHGHETVEAALRMQHSQDVQDWAIHDARARHAG
ncbi:MAG TPA: hypothetical protein VI032_03910 [Burkholderiaceae bacterium]